MAKIFITGASGCVGSYLVDELLKDPDHTLYLLVRHPQKLSFQVKSHPNVHVIVADLVALARYQNYLSQVDYLFHIATVWGGNQAFEVNFRLTLKLFKKSNVKRIFYFSTASILDSDKQLIPIAKYKGTEYIKSKALCYQKLRESDLDSIITYIFPTLIFGGDENHPFTHLSRGLNHLSTWVYWLRFIKVRGSFHFIHAKDIAQVLVYLLREDSQQNHWILGQPALTIEHMMNQLTDYFNFPLNRQIDLEPWVPLIKQLIWFKMTDWDRFCLEERDLVYDVINPEVLGFKSSYPKLKDVLIHTS